MTALPILHLVPVLREVAARFGALVDTLGRVAIELLVALSVLAIGWGLARLASAGLLRLLHWARFDHGVRRLLGGLPPRFEPASLLAWALHWTLVMIVAIQAFDLMGFQLSGAVSARLRELLPRVISAGIVLVVGIALAAAIGAVSRRLFRGAGLRSSALRGRIVSGTLSGFAVLLALEQLGLAAQLILGLSVTVVASVGLAFAIAFGLGCRDLARDFVVEMLNSVKDAPARRPQ